MIGVSKAIEALSTEQLTELHEKMQVSIEMRNYEQFLSTQLPKSERWRYTCSDNPRYTEAQLIRIIHTIASDLFGNGIGKKGTEADNAYREAIRAINCRVSSSKALTIEQLQQLKDYLQVHLDQKRQATKPKGAMTPKEEKILIAQCKKMGWTGMKDSRFRTFAKKCAGKKVDLTLLERGEGLENMSSELAHKVISGLDAWIADLNIKSDTKAVVSI